MYLDWKESQNNGTFVIDIEADSLTPTQIWVMCWRNVKTGETGACTSLEEIRSFLDAPGLRVYVGHNILKFDGPVLNRLAGAKTKLGSHNCIDTLVLSTLYSPSLDGGHSLGAWGQRLGEPKTEFNDWSRLSDEMIEYCHQDVLVTTKLFVKLINVLKKIEFDERSIWIQHNLTEVIHQQEKNGFFFNHAEALSLYSHIRHLEEELQYDIRSVFPPERIERAVRTVARKDGSPTAIYLKDRERYIIELSDDGTTYRALEDVDFNIGSPKQRVDKLLSLGWRPRTFTKTGNPKPFDKGDLSPCLAEFLEEHPVPEVELIARWMAYNGRANMINTWLENLNERDSCIHGRLYVADTLRFRHQAPNTANIPAVRTTKSGEVLRGVEGFFTYESRDLWIARPGRVLVGTDAAGLELRMLAHFLNDPAFTDQVVNGDPHQYNADLAGVTRPQAKTLIYATLYGAGDAKIAATLGVPFREGAEIKRVFLERLGADKLIQECKDEQRRGRVSLCDGSKVVCPSPHAALNYKLQGSGARVMGLGAILLEKAIRRLQLDSLKVGDVHDEWILDVRPDHAEDVASASVSALCQSGERLRLNVPIDGKSLIGPTWAHVH